LDCPRVLARERPLGRVVAPALGSEDEEALHPHPVVDGPGVPAGAVLDLVGAGDRRPLRHASRAVLLQVGHLPPPFRWLNCEAAVVRSKAGVQPTELLERDAPAGFEPATSRREAGRSTR